MLYSIGFSANPKYNLRIACGSFTESTNYVEIVEMDEEAGKLQQKGIVNHEFPASKIMWIPNSNDKHPDIFVTSSDILKVWEIEDNREIKLKSSLVNNQNKELTAPLTSFDWNKQKLEVLCTASIDTTCSLWDINKESVIKQLIAHDKEVFDISFSTQDSNIFATVGADGSARQFDSRDLTKSDILYETNSPLLRVDWNKNNSNYISIIGFKDKSVTIVDTRKPFIPTCKLQYHDKSVNCLSWAPHSA